MVITKKSWRDVLPVHPAADLFPMMSRDELIALGEDIKKYGQRVPVAVFKEQKHFQPTLLDGRNRLDAMEAVGLTIGVNNVGTDSDPHIILSMRGLPNDSMAWPIGVTEVRGDRDGDPYGYVVGVNIHRRHLTAEQRRDLIAKVLKATPGKSNRQIAEQVKVDHKTVGAVRNKLEVRGEVPHVDVTIDTKGRKQPIKKKRRDIDDYLADKRAKEITEKHPTAPDAASTPPTESTERQFAVLTDLWRMNSTLRAAWERSNLKAQRRFVQWLDGGGA